MKIILSFFGHVNLEELLYTSFFMFSLWKYIYIRFFFIYIYIDFIYRLYICVMIMVTGPIIRTCISGLNLNFQMNEKWQ